LAGTGSTSAGRYFSRMKRLLYLGSLLLLTTAPAIAQNLAQNSAQNLAGTWQGVEDPAAARYYPSVLRLRRSAGTGLTGVLYEEIGPRPGITVTFQVAGTRAGNGLRLVHVRKLNETGKSPGSVWCVGSVTLTYNAAEEKLSGRATYKPDGDCDTGEFVFYRVRLKSAATMRAGVPTTLRVSGRTVRWYADAACQKLVATGNTFKTKLSKATTFYLKQGFFPSAESGAVPITVAVRGAAPVAKTRPAARPAAPATAPLSARRAVPLAPADTASAARRPPVTALPSGTAPMGLPTVLFRLSTPLLLPSAYPALDRLATALRAQPTVRLRVVGHTDRLPGDSSEQNQALSEQRAVAVKVYLVKAGVAADRLETAGYGDTRRVYPSPDVRNRRVEVERLP